MLNNVHIPVEINIYGDKVAIVSIYRDIVGIIIEEPHIAESLRNIHQSFGLFAGLQIAILSDCKKSLFTCKIPALY